MKLLKQLLAFLVYSNLFIACCAVLMAWQSAHLLLGEDPDENFLQFVFCSTISSYAFHYYFTTHSVIPSNRIQWQVRNRKLLAFIFLAGLAGSIIFFLRLQVYWPWLLPAVAATFLYSAPKLPHPLFQQLRKVAIGKTIFLAFIWMYVTTVLPVIVSGQTWEYNFTVFAASRYFYIYCICILFDYRDREDDKAEGVRSLITFLNEKNITRLFLFSFLVYTGLTLWLLNFGFSSLKIILLLVPGIILAFFYNIARRNFSDWLYYVLLDGLMAFSAILLLIADI